MNRLLVVAPQATDPLACIWNNDRTGIVAKERLKDLCSSKRFVTKRHEIGIHPDRTVAIDGVRVQLDDLLQMLTCASTVSHGQTALGAKKQRSISQIKIANARDHSLEFLDRLGMTSTHHQTLCAGDRFDGC